jgi:hypothetical protein
MRGAAEILERGFRLDFGCRREEITSLKRRTSGSIPYEERGGERMERGAVWQKLRRERRGGLGVGWHFAVTGSGTLIRRLLMDRSTCGSRVMHGIGDGEGMRNADGGSTLVIVRAGDHWSFRMSKHMLPSGLTFG